jgi:hypothetical protein
MSQPNASQVHVNAPLTNVSIAYIQSANDFIADKVFPVVPVSKQSDIYYTYTKNDWFRDEATLRGPGTESAGGGYNVDSSATYHAFHKDVPDQVRANADSVFDVDSEATKFVSQRLLLRREVQFATKYMTTGVWGKDYTGVAAAPGANQFIKWSDYANSDPVEDMKIARLYIKSITGFRPNTLVLSEEVFETLKSHPDIIDRYKYTTSSVVTADMLARLFEVDRLFISGAVKATNVEGETGAYSFINSKNALLCYTASAPSLMTPSAGYTFAWTGLSNLGFSTAVSKFRMDHLKSDRVEGESAFDCKVVAADLGAYFTAAIE